MSEMILITDARLIVGLYGESSEFLLQAKEEDFLSAIDNAHAFLPRDDLRDLSVGHRASVRDGEHDVADGSPEFRCAERDGRHESGIPAAEIEVQPADGLFENGERSFPLILG